jgi:hypothetical protein
MAGHLARVGVLVEQLWRRVADGRARDDAQDAAGGHVHEAVVGDEVEGTLARLEPTPRELAEANQAQALSRIRLRSRAQSVSGQFGFLSTISI